MFLQTLSYEDIIDQVWSEHDTFRTEKKKKLRLHAIEELAARQLLVLPIITSLSPSSPARFGKAFVWVGLVSFLFFRYESQAVICMLHVVSKFVKRRARLWNIRVAFPRVALSSRSASSKSRATSVHLETTHCRCSTSEYLRCFTGFHRWNNFFQRWNNSSASCFLFPTGRNGIESAWFCTVGFPRQFLVIEFWISEASFIRRKVMPTKTFGYCPVLFCPAKSVFSTFKGILGLKKKFDFKGFFSPLRRSTVVTKNLIVFFPNAVYFLCSFVSWINSVVVDKPTNFVCPRDATNSPFYRVAFFPWPCVVCKATGYGRQN